MREIKHEEKSEEREIQGQEQSSKAYRVEIICNCTTCWISLTESWLSVKSTSLGQKSLSEIVSINITTHLKIKLYDKIRWTNLKLFKQVNLMLKISFLFCLKNKLKYK